MAVIEQQIPTGTWQIDTVHSSLDFEVRHMAVSKFRGSFQEFDATLTSGDDGVRLTGTVKAESLDVRDENLAGHLRSPEFFDTEQYPELSFESTSLRVEGDEVVLDGDFTIRGITKRVEGRGTITEATEDAFGGTRLGLELTTTVDRRDYGLNWNMQLPKGGYALGNDVKLLVRLEFTKAG
jgi:polyisoprenoid-binding protein YceI